MVPQSMRLSRSCAGVDWRQRFGPRMLALAARIRRADAPEVLPSASGSVNGRISKGDVLAYVDTDCRMPVFWMERVEGRLRRARPTVGVTGPNRFYDWDWSGRALIRLCDVVIALP